MAVSGETVRRDLKVLEGRGLLKRVYGGAIAPNSARTSEPPYPPPGAGVLLVSGTSA